LFPGILLFFGLKIKAELILCISRVHPPMTGTTELLRKGYKHSPFWPLDTNQAENEWEEIAFGSGHYNT